MTVETRDEEIPTGHGETATVTVVDCCSCEQTVPLESTKLTVVFDGEVKTKNSHTYKRYKAYGGYTEGRLCERCEDDPIGWPAFIDNEEKQVAMLFMCLFSVFLGIIIGISLV